MKLSDLRPFAHALQACRKKHGLTQAQMAEALSMTRKTYILFESGRWLPAIRERSHFIKLLYDRDPAAAHALVAALGTTLEDHVFVRSPEGKTAPSDAAQAKLLHDAAVYATAEQLDLSPKAVRPIAASLFARLAESGVTMEQAAALAKGAASGGKKGAG
jgi:DNA-binding XRE family transcriptional regulator